MVFDDIFERVHFGWSIGTLGLRYDSDWCKKNVLKWQRACIEGGKADIIYTIHGTCSGPLEQERNIPIRLIGSKRLFEHIDNFPEDKTDARRNNIKGNNFIQIVSRFTWVIFQRIFMGQNVNKKWLQFNYSLTEKNWADLNFLITIKLLIRIK